MDKIQLKREIEYHISSDDFYHLVEMIENEEISFDYGYIATCWDRDGKAYDLTYDYEPWDKVWQFGISFERYEEISASYIFPQIAIELSDATMVYNEYLAKFEMFCRGILDRSAECIY